jgi:hypothetical protein
MSQNPTRPLAERNWADLMDDLLSENFAAQARSGLRIPRSETQARPEPQAKPNVRKQPARREEEA